MADAEANGEWPVPDLPPVTVSPVDKNPVDKNPVDFTAIRILIIISVLVMFQVGDDSDSDGRRHASTSVSKTRISVHTPAEDREAMQQLKQRIDFSDHSVNNPPSFYILLNFDYCNFCS